MLLARLRSNASERSALLALVHQLTEHYELMLKSFYTKDTGLSDEVALQQEALLGLCDKHLQAHKGLVEADLMGKIKSILSHARDISRLVRYLVVKV